jgi:DNA-binding transcriptional ArsR family regulator
MTNRAATDDTLTEVLKALAHPARRRLLRLLADRGTCVCGDLVDAMPLSQATVSQHLKVLKQVGLIEGTIDGPRSCYGINHAEMARRRVDVGELFRSIENCCQPSGEDSP